MTEKGEWISATQNDKFLTSLLIQDRVLKAGKYVVTVSQVWNESANHHTDHKMAFVEILCS